MIAHLDRQVVAHGIRAHDDRRAGRPVAGGMFNQVGQHLIDLGIVGLRRRQIDLQLVRANLQSQALDHIFDQRADILRCAGWVWRIALDPRHIE